MFSTKETFHQISLDPTIQRPEKFTYPFSYVPHPWVVQAATELQQYLETQSDFEYGFGADQKSVGKMFGVLIVENQLGQLGYLAAFSGKINESNNLDGFVPPVYNVLEPDGFFRQGEQVLNKINQEISALENSELYQKALQKLSQDKFKLHEKLQNLKKQQKLAKNNRHQLREKAKELDYDSQNEILLKLENESKRDHFILKDLKRKIKENIAFTEAEVQGLKKPIDALKKQRKQLSSQMQKQMHQSFKFLNAQGESKNLLDIFNDYNIIPPAGAGECAAPRLLNHAYKHELKPLAMGEFWWGESPPGLVRKHQYYYPACKSKCKPILTFMLQGLKVDTNPIVERIGDFEIITVYEDEYMLVVDKPAGVLSVPGKEIKQSLQTKLKEKYPDNKITLVHRLDMATSGLVIVAKDEEVYKRIQKQFSDRTIKKTYTAILDGKLEKNSGKINLPLRVDLDNRPRQMVCYEHGKEAITYYKVLEIKNEKTRILFFPHTGRTHQLRVHAAHVNGLNIPILGDILYGKPHKRLHLHASELILKHPITGNSLHLSSRVPF
ncbi:MAG: pseudouridine synthase [Weeksellaceae bacterium]